MEYCEPPSNAHLFETEKEACDWAFKEAADCVVLEGGVQVITKEEQMIELAWLIKDASERLVTLQETGCQFKDRSEDKDE